MALVPLVVNAQLTKPETAQFQKLVNRVLHEGFDSKIFLHNAQTIGFEGEVPAKGYGTDPEEAVDGLDRTCYLVYKQTESGPKPTDLVLTAASVVGRERPDKWIRFKVDGTLETVVWSVGQFDETGNAIQGSAVITKPDLETSDAKTFIRHELDYWLHDKYRTKLGKLRLKNPNATMADVEAEEAKAKAKKSK